MTRVYIKDISKFEGEQVTLKGWINNKRSSGKIAFIELRDGTGFIQCVLLKNAIGEEEFNNLENIGQESSVAITGVVSADERSAIGYEVKVESYEIISNSTDYPISPKEHGADFLMNNKHLWLRTKSHQAVMRVRDSILRASYDFYHERGFIKFDSPILSATDCEGGAEVFKTDFFGVEASLTQSGQLYGEAGAMAYGLVYVLGPCFRAEKSRTRKHLTEFWMIEPEMAFCEFEENLEVQEAYVSFMAKRVLEECANELEVLGRDIAGLQVVAEGNFPRLRYDEAIKVLNENGMNDIKYGDDLGTEHENFLASLYSGKPVFVTHWPAEIKAFYMQPDPNNPTEVLAADLIAPDGYGEIIGGSQRIHDYDLLKQRLEENELGEDYEWYLDLRRYGSVPHSGFGLGIERTVAWFAGIDHVRETLPFPRFTNRIRP